MTNTGTTKIKKIVARALEIREKAGFTTERIEKRHYNMPYIPDAVKRAAKELKTPGTAPAKRTKRVVKTKFIHFKKSNMGLHKNYVELKKKHPKHIILIRIGEFYETYERDAIDVSKVLGTTLIYKDKIATTGFPVHSLDYKLPPLVNAGYSLAFADRLEDPKLAKTPVKREIPKESEKRKTRIVKTKQLARRKVKRTGTNSRSGAKIVDKKVSISAQTAIADVLTLKKYADLKPLAVGLLYNKFSKEKEVEVFPGEMAYGLFEKLEKADYLEIVSLTGSYKGASRFSYQKDAVTYSLSDDGVNLIKSINARIETLKGKKYGYELFK